MFLYERCLDFRLEGGISSWLHHQAFQEIESLWRSLAFILKNNNIDVKGIKFEEILRAQKKRDRQDSKRELAPLLKAKDAIYVDTSKLSPKEGRYFTALTVLNQAYSKTIVLFSSRMTRWSR